MLPRELNKKKWDGPPSSQALIEFFYDKIVWARLSILDRKSGIDSQLISMQSYQEAAYPACFTEKHTVIWQRHLVLQENRTLPAYFTEYNDLRIFYTYLLAAITISRIHQFDHPHFLKSIFHLYKIHKKKCHESIEYTQEIILEAKKDLLNLLRVFCDKHTDENYKNMLDETKDWVALERPSLVIMTIIDISLPDKKQFLIIDEPRCRLIEEQIKSLKNLRAEAWFQQLAEFQQQLLFYYLPFILSEDRVLPSQLRSIIPFLKNAYTQSIWVKKENGWQQLNTYYHSAAAAYLLDHTEAVALQSTQHNLLQQKMHCHTSASLMICLNSQLADNVVGLHAWWHGLPYKADDGKIIKLTQLAAHSLADQHIYFSKICLNGFRKWEFQNYTGINQIMQIVKDNLMLTQNTRPPLCEKLESYVSLITAIQCEWKLFDDENRGLDMIYYMTKMAFINNLLAQHEQLLCLQSIAVWFGCASGENRTGIVYYNTICQSIIDYLEEEKNCSLTTSEKEQVYEAIAFSQHIHILSGFQGSTLGTEGIRRQSASSLKSAHPKEILLTQSSDHKSIAKLAAKNENASTGWYGLFSLANSSHSRTYAGFLDNANAVINKSKR